MSEKLKKLIESRAAALASYEEFIKPLIESGDALTDEQTAKRTELRGKVDAFDARIDEVAADEKREADLAEKRNSLTAATPAAPKAVTEVNEPTTYGPGSPNSYFADLARSASPSMKGHRAAIERLERAVHEAAVEAATAPSPEKRSRIEALLKEEHRDGNERPAVEVLRDFRALGKTGRAELRSGMDTTTNSGGSFSTPIYFVGDYAPYREAGRAFVDQCNKQPLPEYGMTVYLPHVTGPAGVATQSGQNTAVQETDPTAGYLSGNLSTESGQVTISQQLLDRAGPNFAFDRLVFDQLNRDYAPKVDTLVLNAALAGATTVAYTQTTPFALTGTSGAGGFYSKVSGAKAGIRTAAGTYKNPTHLFLNPSRWELIAAWADSSGRPVVVPDYAGAFNAVAGGSASGDVGVEGATGYRFNGLRVFTDNNIPTPTVGADQAIVGELDEVWVFEGAPVMRTLPQTLGNQLSVILQLYSYITTIVRYPAAIATVTGTGMSTITF